ncbi:MAG: SurA N-terminal domain-containing protein [Rhodospirillales bacterium]|nr:SurA N-terminal domain-containing protein [Rhodospirillales bacterium]
MLSALRKRSGGIVVKSLLILLIISFGAWGIQDWINPAISGNAVATVGSEEISAFEVRRRVNQEMTRMRRLFGDQFTLEQAMAFGIVGGVINDQVNQALISQGASRLGVTISDNLISADIRTQDNFKGLAGNFDRTRFEQVLAANGLSEGDYVNTIRRSLSGLQYTDSFQSGARAPKVMVDAIYKFRNEKRIVDVALVKDEMFAAIGEPTAQQIEAFHKDQAKQFTAPEYRKISFLRLEAADLADEMEVSAEDITKAYEARLEEYTTIEKRNILQMVLSDEEKAKTAHKQLLEGRDFAVVAKEIAGLDESVLDLGLVTKTDLLPELAEPAFALMSGTVTPPVKSSLGWHLLKVTQIQPGGTKALAEVRDQVAKAVAREKAIDGLYDLSNRIEDELGGGATVEEAANNLNLKVTSLAAIDTAGKDLAGNVVTNIPAGRAFIQAVFTTEEGETSALTESGPEGFFIVRVDAITAPALRPIETVRNEIIAAWKADQASAQAKTLAEKLVAEINAGTLLSAVVSANNLTPATTSKPFTRDDSGTESGLDNALVEKAFALDPGKAATGKTAGGYQVVVLNSVIPADPGSDKDGVDLLRAELSGDLKSDVTQQLVTALRDDIGVDINQLLVNQMFADQTSAPY